MTESDTNVLRLAATLLATEVTPALLDSLQVPDTRAALSGIEPACADLLERSWQSADFENAAVEFCRLFILNPAAPPRAAAWLEEVSGIDALVVAGMMQSWIDDGFLEVEPAFSTLPPDHVALLLFVLAEIGRDDPDRAAQFRQDQLDSWLPQFLERLEEESGHPFYTLAAKLVRGVLA